MPESQKPASSGEYRKSRHIEDINLSALTEEEYELLPEDARTALALDGAGLECILGALRQAPGDANMDMEERIAALVADSQVGNVVTRISRAGRQAFYGPSARLDGDVLTVDISREGLVSEGVWVPKEGKVVDPDSIPAQRLV